MNYDTIKSELAPCGLDCSRCVFSANGGIRRNAEELHEGLRGFEKMAKMFAANVPALAEYDSFTAVLTFLMSGECRGCRKGASCYEGCEAKNCVKEKEIDFCFECESFPCDKNRYHPQLEEKWKENNFTMRNDGVEFFHAAQKKKPRY